MKLKFIKLKTVKNLRKLRITLNETIAKEFLDCKINKVISIYYYGRSGSYFLHSLLENHPNILAMNSEFREFWKLPEEVFEKRFEKQVIFILSNWFGCVNSTKTYDNFTDFRVLSKPVHVPKDLLVNYENCEFDILPEFEKSLKKPELRTFVSALYFLGENIYGKDLKKKSLSRLELFELFHLAWAVSLEKRPQPKFYILFNAHVPDRESLRNLEEVIPTICVHTVRNPIQSLSSHLARYLDESVKTDWDGDIHNNVLNVLAHFVKQDTFLSDKYRDQEFAIRLEDLHNDPESTLRTCAQRLDLEYHTCLLSETFNGGQYKFPKGNSFVSGFNNSRITKKYSEVFSQSDCSKLEEIFMTNYQKWDYPFLATQKGAMPQSSVENLLSLDFLTNIQNFDLLQMKLKIGPALEVKLARSKDEIFPVLFPSAV